MKILTGPGLLMKILMEKQRPLILISNDDGVLAAGVHRLIDFLHELGDIVCLCPDSPRSGGSMALTVSSLLRLTEHPSYRGARMFSTNGTPTDCIKLAWHTVLRDRKPDLVVTGINHGSNAAINVIYSGTMGAAREGCAFGVPSIGFSLTDHSPNADFTYCEPFVKAICRGALEHGLPKGLCLNVNVPDSAEPPVRMRLVRECRGNWSDEYVEYHDPAGHPFYMLSGHFRNDEPEATDTDEYVLHRGEVSVVPTQLQTTAAVAGLRVPAFPADSLDWLVKLCEKKYTHSK